LRPIPTQSLVNNLKEIMMAAIFVLAGGIFGFTSALVSLFLMDTSILMALAIWSGVGLLVTAVGIAASLTTRRAVATVSDKIASHARSA
jgi:hypothetical protein